MEQPSNLLSGLQIIEPPQPQNERIILPSFQPKLIINESSTNVSSISSLPLNNKKQSRITKVIKSVGKSSIRNSFDGNNVGFNSPAKAPGAIPVDEQVVEELRTSLKKKFLISPGLFEDQIKSIRGLNNISYERLVAIEELTQLKITASSINVFTYKSLYVGSTILGGIFGMGDELAQEIDQDIALIELTKQYMVDALIWIPDIAKLGMMFASDCVTAYKKSLINRTKKLLQPQPSNFVAPRQGLSPLGESRFETISEGEGNIIEEDGIKSNST
jgi:hypothetical protein